VNLFTIAFSNLRRRKSRLLFLVAGLVVGIATVVTLLSLQRALTVDAQNNLESYGANIVVSPRSDDVSLTYGGVALGGVSLAPEELRMSDVARIRHIPNRRNVALVAPELLGVTKVRGQDVLLMGVDPDQEFRLKKWWSIDGRAIQSTGEAVAGSAVARRLGLVMGEPVEVGGKSLTLVGTIRETGSQDDNLLLTDLGVAQSVLGKPGKATMVEVAALCSNCPIGKMVLQISDIFPGAKVSAVQQVVKGRMHALEQFRSFGLVLALVVIAIEILVVFITVMGSVSARTREIGIFRALGFRRGHVVGLILAESLATSALAGGLAYVAGIAITVVLVPFLAKGSVDVGLQPLLLVLAVALSLAVGGLASLYPALRASRLDPTEALRAL
jgi:putative ABC transport system permease protein